MLLSPLIHVQVPRQIGMAFDEICAKLYRPDVQSSLHERHHPEHKEPIVPYPTVPGLEPFCSAAILPRLRRVRPTGHTVFRLTVGNRLQILLWNGGKEFCQPAEVPLLVAGNCRWAAWRMRRPLKFEPLVPRWSSCQSMSASAGFSVTRSSKLMGAFGSRFISATAKLKILRNRCPRVRGR